jgi:hypothetical protein
MREIGRCLGLVQKTVDMGVISKTEYSGLPVRPSDFVGGRPSSHRVGTTVRVTKAGHASVQLSERNSKPCAIEGSAIV